MSQPSSFTPPAGPVELKFKWPTPGKRIVLDMEVKHTFERPLPGQPGPVQHDLSMGLVYGFTVLHEIPDQGHEVEMEFLGTRMGMMIGGMTWLYDSSKETSADGPNSPWAGVFGKIVGSKIRYFLNASNEVQRMEGVDDLVKRLKPVNPLASIPQADPLGRLGNMFRNWLTEPFFKRVVKLNYFLPPKAVRLGDTWRVQDDSLSGGTMVDLVREYDVTFQSWERRGNRNCARLKLEGTLKGTVKIKSDPTSNPGGGLVLLEGKWVEAEAKMSISVPNGTSSGSAWFDPDLGILIETVLSSDLKTVSSLSASPTGNPGAAGPTANFTHQIKQLVTHKLVSVE